MAFNILPTREANSRSMHIRGIFGEKQDIDGQKQDIDGTEQNIDEEKQDIESILSAHQQKQYEKLVKAFGKAAVFGRSDMVAVLDITPSPASALIKKLLEAGKIEAVTGHGKGKYIVK